MKTQVENISDVKVRLTISLGKEELEAAEQVTGPYEQLEVTPAEAGGRATVNLPATAPQRCFRLRMP